MKFTLGTILFIVILVLPFSPVFSQYTLKFKVKESYLRAPDSLRYPRLDDWYYYGSDKSYFVTIDLINNKLRTEYDGRLYTTSIFVISQGANATNDSVCVKFGSFTKEGRRVEYLLYKSPVDKYYTIISSAPSRQDKKILEYIIPES
jgi:hypothetical protein